MRLLDTWAGLPWWLRYGLAIALILGSSYLFFNGMIRYRGWAGMAAVGIGLLVVGRSESDKKGYHF